MPRLYKGVGVGTFLHTTHSRGIRGVGIAPQSPTMTYTVPGLIQHIAGNTVGPYVSLTRSYGVAWNYAMDYSRTAPTSSAPAYVFAIDIEYSDLPRGTIAIDPVFELSKYVNDPLAANSYHHNGEMDFLLGIVNPTTMSHFVGKHARPEPNTTTSAGPPRRSLELQAMVRALRDAEVIVCGSIPGRLINDVHPVS